MLSSACAATAPALDVANATMNEQRYPGMSVTPLFQGTIVTRSHLHVLPSEWTIDHKAQDVKACCRSESLVEDAIDCCMTMVAVLTPTTAEAMDGKLVNLRPTAMVGMWQAKR